MEADNKDEARDAAWIALGGVKDNKWLTFPHIAGKHVEGVDDVMELGNGVS